MSKGKRARNGRNGPAPAFDQAWMERIEAETARVARPYRLPEDRVRAIAHEVAIVLWQRRARRSADP